MYNLFPWSCSKGVQDWMVMINEKVAKNTRSCEVVVSFVWIYNLRIYDFQIFHLRAGTLSCRRVPMSYGDTRLVKSRPARDECTPITDVLGLQYCTPRLDHKTTVLILLHCTTGIVLEYRRNLYSLYHVLVHVTWNM
jgi:hypothetical protein